MKQWILEQIAAFLISNLTEENLKKWKKDLEAKLMPYLRDWKIELLQKLRAAAADTNTPLDDLAVDALEKILDLYIK